MAAKVTVTTLARRVLSEARKNGYTIATAESCTGGMVAAALTSIAGSSDVFDRGFVTYSNAAKTAMIGVPAKLIESVGAVSAEVAAAMAEGALRASGAGLAWQAPMAAQTPSLLALSTWRQQRRMAG